MKDHDYDDEPTDAELTAIEDAEPLLAAEWEWVTAEIALLAAAGRGRSTELDARRVRRAEHEVIRQTFAHVTRLTRRAEQRRAA